MRSGCRSIPSILYGSKFQQEHFAPAGACENQKRMMRIMAKIVQCPHCGADTGDGNFCGFCGKKIAQECDCHILHRKYRCKGDKCRGILVIMDYAIAQEFSKLQQLPLWLVFPSMVRLHWRKAFLAYLVWKGKQKLFLANLKARLERKISNLLFPPH